jgi:hypothetical protein
MYAKNGRYEHWMAPAGGLMMGMARNIRGGKVREYEFTLLRQEANGDFPKKIVYARQADGSLLAASRVSLQARYAIASGVYG